MILFAATLLCSCIDKSSFKQISFDGSRAVADIKNLKEKQAEFYTASIDGRKIDFFMHALPVIPKNWVSDLRTVVLYAEHAMSVIL